MKEWRSEADEECRQLAELALSGVATVILPNLHFEQFMLSLGDFYGSPGSAKLSLSEVFFLPINQDMGTPLRRIPQSKVNRMTDESSYLLTGLLTATILCFFRSLYSSSYGPAEKCFRLDCTWRIYKCCRALHRTLSAPDYASKC